MYNRQVTAFFDMNVTINGIKIYYEQHGKGKHVLVLHGWGASIETMRPVIDALSAKFRVTALDFPGFGGSGMPDDTYGVPEYMDVAYRLLRNLGITKTHVICHSFGGRVAIMLAAAYPRLTEKIVFTGAAGLIKRRTIKQRARVRIYKAAKFFNRGHVVKRLLQALGADVEKYIKNAGSADYKALSNDMKKVFVRIVNLDLKSLLSNIKSPSLLIWGENDTETPVEFGRIMERLIPDSGLVVFKHAGHYAFLECFDRFMLIVKTFLEDNK